MKVLLKLVFILALAFILACVNAWQAVYIGGATTAALVTDAHKLGWSEPLNARARECDAKLNAETDTKSDFDQCMGTFAPENNDKVVYALERYNAAADILTKTLQATDPERPDPVDRTKILLAWAEVYQSALAFLKLLPDGDKHVERMKRLVKR